MPIALERDSRRERYRFITGPRAAFSTVVHALVFAEFGEHLVRGADEELGKSLPEHLHHRRLMLGPDVAVKKTDRYSLDRFALELGEHAFQRAKVRRNGRVGGEKDALVHFLAQMPRHQGRRLVQADVVVVRLPLAPDLQYVAEAAGGDERRFGGAARDHRIGGDRGTMAEVAHLRRLDAGLGEEPLHALHDGGGEIRWARRGLVEQRPPIRQADQRDVGERAADVDAKRVGFKAQLFLRASRRGTWPCASVRGRSCLRGSPPRKAARPLPG
jgi:hypothetical protein